ncbi:MAG: GAF domain-containing protein [Thermomicrobiales bacterium]
MAVSTYAAQYSQAEITSCPDIVSALGQIVRRFSAAGGAIHVLDSDGLLHLAASEGVPEGLREALRTLPVGKGISGQAVERRQAVSGSMQMEGTSEALAMPIFRGDAVIGALAIGSATDRTFTEAEMDSLMEAGRAIGTSFLGSLQSSAA